MSNNLSVGSTYTFNTLAPSILGAVIQNAVLLMIADFNIANKFENVQVKYNQIYPALPPGSPQSANDVVFYLFQDQSGNNIFIADPWIDSASLVGVTNLNFSINVSGLDSNDLTNIQTVLSHLGINYTLTPSATTTTSSPVTSPSEFVIGNTYTFNTLAPTLLGATINNAVLDMACSFTTAMKFQDVGTLYSQIYPALPSSVNAPVSPTNVTFYVFITESGEKIFIASPWIDFTGSTGTAPVQVTSIGLTINVVNATSTDKSNITAGLTRLGVTYSLVN